MSPTAICSISVVLIGWSARAAMQMRSPRMSIALSVPLSNACMSWDLSEARTADARWLSSLDELVATSSA
jgi:hypothetical protein